MDISKVLYEVIDAIEELSDEIEKLSENVRDLEKAVYTNKDDISETEFKKELFKRVVIKSGIAKDKYVLRDYAAYISRYSDLPVDEYAALLKESYPRYSMAVNG